MLAAPPPRRISSSVTRNDRDTLSSLSARSWSANRPGNVIRWSVAIDPVTAMRIEEAPSVRGRIVRAGGLAALGVGRAAGVRAELSLRVARAGRLHAPGWQPGP